MLEANVGGISSQLDSYISALCYTDCGLPGETRFTIYFLNFASQLAAAAGGDGGESWDMYEGGGGEVCGVV